MLPPILIGSPAAGGGHDESLDAIIAHMLAHEIGHHFGLSDDDIAAIEASVD